MTTPDRLAEKLTFEQKTAINKRFQELYEAGMQSGRHGHYETMFSAMHTAYAESTATPVPGVSDAGRADLIAWLRKASKAIYLACDGPVADDISPKLIEAAAALEAAVQSGVRVKALDLKALPTLPDDDQDFTPNLARAIISKYQQLLSALTAPVEAVATEPVSVPEFFPVAQRKLDSLLADGWTVNGYAIMKGEDRRGFVDFGGFVGWWLPEYYKGHTSDTGHPTGDSGALREAHVGLLVKAKLALEGRYSREYALALIEVALSQAGTDPALASGEKAP